MVNKPLYCITGTMMIIGTSAALYGLQVGSFSMFVEGCFLAWLGFSITVNMMEDR